MRVICVANRKGGVGKTTTAVNLAFGLAKSGDPTLLVDIDPQSNSTAAVLGRRRPDVSIYDLLLGNTTLSSVIFEGAVDGLDLIPSVEALVGAPAEVRNQPTLLRDRVGKRGFPRKYKFVIIDTPPSLGLLTLNALAVSREVIVPMDPSVFALKAIGEVEGTVARVRDRLNNPKLQITGVVYTKYDYTNVAKDVLRLLKKRYPKQLYKVVIPRNVKIEEAHARAQSIFDYAPRSKGAIAYAKFVEEVKKRE